MVLGGNGFIGTNLCKYLAGKELEVYSMDIREPKMMYPGVKYIAGDFFDDVFLREIIQDKDVVYHAISTVQPGNSNEKYMSGYSRDLLQTVKLCSFMLDTKAKLIFLSSGGTVYGNQKVQPIKEEATPLPINHYGNVKLCIENTIRVFNQQRYAKMMIARIANPYGPAQDYQKGVGFIDAVLKQSLNHKTVSIWGDGNIVRDYIYIENVCEMLYYMAGYEGKEEVFNLSSGVGTSQNQIIDMVREINGEIQAEYSDYRSVDAKKIILDNTKIKSIYHGNITSIQDGIREYYKMLKRQMEE